MGLDTLADCTKATIRLVSPPEVIEDDFSDLRCQDGLWVTVVRGESDCESKAIRVVENVLIRKVAIVDAR